ncbi:MAG: hypothetical protein ACREIV_03680, partial [Planctomycetaceae bacterium]
YEVREEVNVGAVPLRVDIMLIRREGGELPESARGDLPALADRLNRWTLIEFKGPTDALARGDLDQLFGVAHLFCAQQNEPIPSRDLSLIILAPAFNQSIQEDLKIRGFSATEEEPGIYRITHPVFTTWMLETDRLTGPEEPVLTLISRVLLRDRRRIMEQMRHSGHADMMYYALQQIRQFQQLGEGFTMQHKNTEEMDDFEVALIESFSPEARLRGIPLEERLRGLPPEELLRVLSLEDILKGLSEAERARLRELLEREASD